MTQRSTHGLVPVSGRCARLIRLGLLPMALALVLALPVAAAGSVSNLPPRPDPPQPYVPPTPAPSPAPQRSAGATICLRVAPGIPVHVVPPDIWTVVQWEDGAGAWHDVDGWRGHLDDAQAGTKTWWVSAADLSRGPFRWAVLQGENGQMLATSAPFYLPATTGQVQWVDVTLP